ncbi:hypothetical protein [Streptomyces rapamycinicus]|uniref:Uncharacterized protein n=2 Tax=Streptomyces rapamycinicus TaxID=1226757 RepID=A0A0A0NCF6_STRRN|nr:hypothetical protein [Streptomyces rapamycinicus]AGP53778.1 hypothetical protein M271_10885 [Streptomyces rapamycinicus NRRL 5491]MBB4781266.1 hypothetical protein [Streptomyces rapamycinicus]RLV74090.1 hypothetical protein D3C57_132730 [Streptomyces rapamycinicus NRRL 5491]UTO61899.1 hypothetical protein LJB45_05925 [Streptomyces rapamycinicus]UTP29851.1 hypothetical protein LIV37_11040 [Streptomyces rapamycinicus NRRL 5491]
MAAQITVTTQPAAESTPIPPPLTSRFAPQVSTHPVATLTLGRQNANDSDKSNYFESP